LEFFSPLLFFFFFLLKILYAAYAAYAVVDFNHKNKVF